MKQKSQKREGSTLSKSSVEPIMNEYDRENLRE